jgi:hypothetical protein
MIDAWVRVEPFVTSEGGSIIADTKLLWGLGFRRGQTTADLYNAIPSEVQFIRLARCYRRHSPRGKYPWHGHSNSGLAHIFPPSQRFQISCLTDILTVRLADRRIGCRRSALSVLWLQWV